MKKKKTITPVSPEILDKIFDIAATHSDNQSANAELAITIFRTKTNT